MANKMRTKQYTDKNVYDAAVERINYLYDNFDGVVVSFSGGKDSTACLNLTIEVARERNRLPVRAIFFDEEAIHPTTIEYIERVRKNPDVKLEWYCLQVKHRNACSSEEPFWYCWDDEKQDLWVRPLPADVITDHADFKKGDSFQDFCPSLIPHNHVLINGIRTQESLRRYQVIARKKNEAFIGNNGKAFFSYPIYDWDSVDVWKLIEVKGYDYNTTYDIFNRTQLNNQLLKQRVCPPFGEEPLRGLWIYAECFPDMWHKMLYRCKGVATAWRYANTELYSNTDKPDNTTWKDYMNMLLENYTEVETRNQVKSNINRYITQHYTFTNQVISDEDPHPLSGISYKFLCRIAVKGDFKNRQSSGRIAQAELARKKLGITEQEAQKIYGKNAKL